MYNVITMRLYKTLILLMAFTSGAYASDIFINFGNSGSTDIGVMVGDTHINGGMAGSGYEGGLQGAFWDGGEGWYARPSADGSGWEFGMLHSISSGGPIKYKWTPSGWSVLEGPTNTSIVFYSSETGWVPYDPSSHDGARFTLADYETGTLLFDSDNFNTNSVPSPEDLAWWDSRIEQFYSDNPTIPRPSNSSGDVIASAQELNKGLEFSNGQWTVKP